MKRTAVTQTPVKDHQLTFPIAGAVEYSDCTSAEGWFGLVSSFNGISTFVGYLMPKPFS